MKLLALSLLFAAFSFAADDRQLLAARERVWRAWFAGDAKAVAELVPPGSIAISAGERDWKSQSQILAESKDFHARGGKLVRLEFPRTEVQHFGTVAIIYSTYQLEIEQQGKRTSEAGRVTEVFVFRNSRWVNPGWHTDHQEQ